MDKEKHITKLIDDTINSVDNINRAAPAPFLLTRVNTRLTRAKGSIWEKAVWFIGRPVVAVPGLVMLIIINATVVVFNRADRFTTATEQPAADEFSYPVATLYDIDNTEP